ncbi:MAG TPA: ATP-binding cassette domain-containing protein [Chloroflexi bacterium]|nr:ATP-binding cassette domain-containing protein [Chloroflexota bacterium]
MLADDANARTLLLSEAAQAYYERGSSLAQIAAELGISAHEVNDLLEEARRRGIVQVNVLGPYATNAELEQRLQAHFPSVKAFVLARENRSDAKTNEVLGVLAAQVLADRLQPHSIIGISWGRTLYQMIHALPPMNLPDAEVVQLIGATGSESSPTDGPMLAQLLAHRLGCRATYLHCPVIVESAAGRNALLQERHIREALQRGEKVDIALVGIGSTAPEQSSLLHAGYLDAATLAAMRAAGAVGDICAQHFGANGEWLDIDINRRVIGISLHALAKVGTVIGVASGAVKAVPILAALRGQHVDVLITDDQAARAVLTLVEAHGAPTLPSQPGVEVRASLKSIWKVFDGVPVLRGVDIELRRGEIHAVLGGNGSGKSTLMKILAGIYTADAGSIELDGVPVTIGSPAAAHRLGIYLAPQEPKIFPHLSVLENLILGTELPPAAALEQIRLLTAELGFEANLSAAAGNLSIANQQLVEIMRGLLREARVLILDEPTSTLTSREVDALFVRMRTLAQRGIGIFFISHRLNEILHVSDRVSVLRDGAFVLSAPTSTVKSRDLIRAMLPEGERATEVISRSEAAQAPVGAAAPVLEVRGLTGEMFRDVTFQVRSGEVVGLAGLVGAGRSELARAIVGIDAATAGTVTVAGRTIVRRTPRTCQDAGLVYVPEDRHSHGIFLNLPNLYTMSASILHQLGRPLLSAPAEQRIGARFVEQLRIKVNSLQQVSRTLSGGNQQKTVLAKSLVSAPKVVILDEPTRGIDARARVDVHMLIHELTQQGLGVLLISSDFEEVIELSDRVLVMYHGRLVEELPHAQCQIERITAAAFGLKESRAL